MIHFLFPLAFLVLPLPWLVRRMAKPAPLSTAGAIRMPYFKGLAGRTSHAGQSKKLNRPWRWVALSVVWLMLVTAFARPVLLGDEVALPVASRDLMFAIDLSGSMARENFNLDGAVSNRLSVIKSAADDFITRRVGDRVGLVLFSNRAYVQAPLTLDRQVVSQLLDDAQVGLTGQETAIGDAIAIAVKRLKDRPAQSRVLVLMTDGANNAGVLQPLQAAELARDLGIRIYTIGVSANSMAVSTRMGTQVVNPSEDLDEPTLQAIADMTDGQYFRATDTQSLAQVYKQLDELEPVADEPIFVQPTVSLFHWPLAIAFSVSSLLGLMLLAPMLKNRFHIKIQGNLIS